MDSVNTAGVAVQSALSHNPLSFADRCKQNPDACGAGLIVGMIIVLIIVIFMWFFRSKERFAAGQVLNGIYGGSPLAQYALSQARTADPIVTTRGRNEHMSNIKSLWG